jgi:phosphatidylglycerophosphate synthase
VAAVLDAVDGRLARASGMASRFGARFDLETDAALVMILAVLAWQFGQAGPWVLAIGLARYGFVLAGRVWTWLRRPLAPSFRRQAVAAVQMAALLVIGVAVISYSALRFRKRLG